MNDLNDALAQAEAHAELNAQMFDDAAATGAGMPSELDPEPLPDHVEQDPPPEAQAAATEGSQLPKELMEALSDPEQRAQIRAMLGVGDTGYDPRDLQGNPILFYRCTHTHYGPVLAPDGTSKKYRMRPNAPLIAVERPWIRGRIYPFRSIAQLPPLLIPQWEEDENGNPVWMEDPKQRGNELADLIRKPKMTVNPENGKREQVMLRPRPDAVAFFEPVRVSDNQAQMFLQGMGFHRTGIEEPVSGAKVPGNYVDPDDPRRQSHQQARSLTPEERARLIERDMVENIPAAVAS